MTCISSTISSSYATMVSDSGITWGDNTKASNTNKIVQQGSWLIGAAGLDRVCDVVQYQVRYPQFPKNLDLDNYDELMKFMVSKVVPVIRESLQVEKSLWDDHGVAEIPDESYFMLVTHGRSFTISESFGVSVNRDYTSIGSGSNLALGYLAAAWKDPNWNKKHDLHAVTSVESAIKHDSYCSAPIMAYKSFEDGEVKMYRKGLGVGVMDK